MRSSSVLSFYYEKPCCSSFACSTGSAWYTLIPRFFTGFDMMLCLYFSSSASF
jgi:hypothetical protein